MLEQGSGGPYGRGYRVEERIGALEWKMRALEKSIAAL
jgi:hypothetical protein